MFHRALQELQCSQAISPLRRENLEHFACVINRPPRAVRLAADPHGHLVQAPAGIRAISDTPLSYLRGEQRTEPVPPESQRLMANVDAAREHQVFDLAERQWITHARHHRQAERVLHSPRLGTALRHLKSHCSDTAPSILQRSGHEIHRRRLPGQGADDLSFQPSPHCHHLPETGGNVPISVPWASDAPDAAGGWWARQDSNLQQHRYER